MTIGPDSKARENVEEHDSEWPAPLPGAKESVGAYAREGRSRGPANGQFPGKRPALPGAADRPGYRLDPPDWDAYRAQMHALLDSCCDRMESYRERPWIPPPPDLAAALELDAGGSGRPLPEVMEELVSTIMPHATGNTHPSFFGWVHGAGLPSSLAADLVAGTMNSNCGGRNQGAAAVEVACIDFLAGAAGFPQGSGPGVARPFGVLTGGTSQATILALLTARTAKFGRSVRRAGILGAGPVRVYASEDAHSCVSRAMDCLGHGSDAVIRIPAGKDGSMSVRALRLRLREDAQGGTSPLAIVGTAGSVTLGAHDDLDALADVAAERGVWLHVDAAFGFWTRLSDDPRVRRLARGMGRADSVALDAHKWPGVNYDCGALLARDGAHLRGAFASRPAYLKSAPDGLAGGDVWFADYSLDLSRGFRALKLWAALRAAGRSAIGAVVTDCCCLASHMAALVDASPLLRMAHKPASNVVCFDIVPGGVKAADVAADLQLRGEGVFSTVRIGRMDCLRAALVNHRTTEEDVVRSIASVEEAVKRRARLDEP